MNKSKAMKVAVNACTCGHMNLPIIGGKHGDEWLFGYICERCGRMEMSGMVEWGFEGWDEKTANSLIKASRKVYAT